MIGALCLALASCAGPRPAPTATLPAPALEPVTETAAPQPTLPPGPAEATSAPATEAASPATEAPPTEATPLYKGIPQGVTPDGFFFLGQGDAPVTLTDYSDFL